MVETGQTADREGLLQPPDRAIDDTVSARLFSAVAPYPGAASTAHALSPLFGLPKGDGRVTAPAVDVSSSWAAVPSVAERVEPIEGRPMPDLPPYVDAREHLAVRTWVRGYQHDAVVLGWRGELVYLTWRSDLDNHLGWVPAAHVDTSNCPPRSG